MKIGQHLITSIACFRKHFDFKAVWHQLDIFIRDMSPSEVIYPDEDSKLLYEIIADGENASHINNEIQYKDKTMKLNFSDASVFNSSILENKSESDKIKIIALFELGQSKFDESKIKAEINIGLETSDIILKYGETIRQVDVTCDENLFVRKIRVELGSPNSIVAGVEVKPGQIVFGLFCNRGLYQVLNPTAKNEKFILRLIETQGTIETIAKDRVNGTINYYKGVISFCVIGEDDYAYIANNRVYCYKNSGLEKALRDNISLSTPPIAVEYTKNKLIVTLINGKRKEILIKNI